MPVLRDAVIDRLGRVHDGLTYYTSTPTRVHAPAVFVLPGYPYAEHHLGFCSSLAAWWFTLTLFVDNLDPDNAGELLAWWTDPAGPFVAALESDGMGDDLDRLTHGHVAVELGTDYIESRQGSDTFMTAQLRVALHA